MRKIVVPTLFAAMLIFTACANTNAAQEWKSIENDAFSFSIPTAFQNMNSRGFDSFVETYVTGDVVLTFDYFINSNNRNMNSGLYDFYNWPADTTFEDLKVSGKPVRVGMAKHELSRAHPYSAKAYIYTERVSLAVSAECKSEDGFTLFKRIVETISFKESKSTP